jgi:hypothetical protein
LAILKRLRATPLRPQTTLSAHVIVKFLLTAATLAWMCLAGKRYFPPGAHVPWFSFTIALLISTWSVLSIGFVIASIVPTARFAQPIGAIVLYPMIAFSGLFVHISDLPPVLRAVARVLPLNYAVRLLEGKVHNSSAIRLQDFPRMIIRSVEEFVKEITKLCEEWFPDDSLVPWCRGQERAEWDLIPKLYRGVPEDDLDIEHEIREEFATRAPAPSDYVKLSDDSTLYNWESYFVMQHYGAPTRLFDWPESRSWVTTTSGWIAFNFGRSTK